MIRRGLALALAAALWAGAAAAACDAADAGCAIDGGTYRIEVPPGDTGPRPAVIMLHGFGGDGRGVLRNRGLVDRALARGYAVIAPDGLPRPGRPGRSWSFHPLRPALRDETAFLKAVADDAAARFGLDRARMLLAGFSIGGSMVSYVACTDPGAFAAFAPVAGSFWRPHPAACAGPARLLHTHGTADRTVPLEGREVSSGLRQGNVFEAMEIWRAAFGCTGAARDRRIGIFAVQASTDCAPGGELVLALHDGAHGIPESWAGLALDWFERR